MTTELVKRTHCCLPVDVDNNFIKIKLLNLVYSFTIIIVVINNAQFVSTLIMCVLVPTLLLFTRAKEVPRNVIGRVL